MSGGKSSSRSRTQSSNSTDNSNTQINDTEGLVLNFEGSENNEATIIQTDQGAIASAFDFGESALESANDTASEAFAFGEEALEFGEDSLDSVDRAVERSLNVVDRANDRALDFGEDSLDSVDRAVDRSLDAIERTNDRAFDFGDDAIERSFEFGQDVVGEAQDITRSALNIAGNAQTNAFSKIREIAESFTTGTSSTTRMLLIGFGVAGVLVAIAVLVRSKGK